MRLQQTVVVDKPLEDDFAYLADFTTTTEWDPGTVKTVLQHRIPWPGGEGRPMRVSLPPGSVPIYLATLSPKMLELTGEIADGWVGTSFVPEGSAAYFAHLDAGHAGRRRGRGGSRRPRGGRRAAYPNGRARPAPP
jgi:alkanesulfonate monooxygenase SsuD/methylene tetrahydromethanopterin reductase-like flavin-dependent oxidoreductase (luciferase family)